MRNNHIFLNFRMKHRFITGLFLNVLFLNACSSSKSLSDESVFMHNKIVQGEFTLVADYVNPRKGSWMALMSDYYTITLRNDSVFAELPYYGRTKSAALLNTQGRLKFGKPVENYLITKKKAKWEIKFDVNTGEEELNLLFKIKHDGVCKFTINSEKRDSVVYKGYFK